ncbi:MAG: hypothetical protein AB7H80_10275 [Candidatus Kapaibacterium sp.]
MNTRTKAILGLSAVFLIGLLCGGLAVGLFVRQSVRERENLKSAEGFRAYFVDRLQLTEGQRDSLTHELQRAYEEIAEIREGAEFQYEQIFDTLTERVAPILNPKQQVLLEEERRHLLPRRPHDQLRRHVREQSRSMLRTEQESFEDSAAIAALLRDIPTEESKGEQKHVVQGDVSLKPNDSATVDGDASDIDMNPLPGLPGADVRAEELPRLIEFLKTKLDLSEDQVEQLQVILKKAVRRNTWIRENFQSEPRQRAKRQWMNLGLLVRQVNNILTEDQQNVFQELMKEWKQKQKVKKNGEKK